VSWVALAIVGASLVAGVVFWVRIALSDRVELAQRNAALRVSDERIDALEKAAAAERVARAEELNGKAREVRTAGDAARLLREHLPRARKPR
jgi:hypothetical protein